MEVKVAKKIKKTKRKTKTLKVVKKSSKKAKKSKSAKSTGKGKYVKQSSARTRCTLYASKNKAGKVLYAQFNPEKLPVAHSANFVQMKAPGMNYPVMQYVGGEATEFELVLFFHDIPFTGSIAKARKWIRNLLPPSKNRKKVFEPPVVDFKCGWFTCKFVAQSMSEDDELQDEQGRALITRFTINALMISGASKFKK